MRIRIGTEVISNLSLNLIENSNDVANFLHKIFLNDTQVFKICKKF